MKKVAMLISLFLSSHVIAAQSPMGLQKNDYVLDIEYGLEQMALQSPSQATDPLESVSCQNVLPNQRTQCSILSRDRVLRLDCGPQNCRVIDNVLRNKK